MDHIFVQRKFFNWFDFSFVWIDKDEDAILVDGILEYCNDLGVAPEDVVMLVLAWNLEAEKIEFKRQGFINGWTKLR